MDVAGLFYSFNNNIIFILRRKSSRRNVLIIWNDETLYFQETQKETIF